MIPVLTLMLMLACFLIAMFSFIDYGKSVSKRSKRKKLNVEAFNFLNSEEGFLAEENVASLCNEIGIKLESDKEDDSGVLHM